MKSRCIVTGACLLTLCLLAGCASYSMWSRTEEFLQQLNCGMSPAEVAMVASEFRGLELREVSDNAPWDIVAVKGQTTIYLDFTDVNLARPRFEGQTDKRPGWRE
jgi:hypothetical protein